jgi:outer membrane beta-barrel protein
MRISGKRFSVLLLILFAWYPFAHSKNTEKSPLESYRIDTHYGPRVAVLKSLYDKEGKVQLKALGSYLPYSSLYNAWSVGGGLSFFFNQSWGWSIVEGQYYKTQLSGFLAQDNFDSFRSGNSISVPKLKVASSVLWSPIYSKMHLTQKTLLHFDLVTGVGLGWGRFEKRDLNFTNPQSVDTFGGQLKLGFRFWLPPRWTLELEFDDFISRVENFSSKSVGHTLGMNISLGLFFGEF